MPRLLNLSDFELVVKTVDKKQNNYRLDEILRNVVSSLSREGELMMSLNDDVANTVMVIIRCLWWKFLFSLYFRSVLFSVSMCCYCWTVAAQSSLVVSDNAMY